MKQIYAMKKIAVALMLAVAMPAAVQAQSETNVLFYESFNSLDGQGGNDGYFDNNTEAGVEVGAEDLLSSEKLDNPEGWGDFVKVSICDKCVRIATKKNNGELTTPAFAVNGNATLTFNAAAQEGDIVTLYVELTGEGSLEYDGQSANKIEIALPETVFGTTVLANQTYNIAISANGSTAVKFSTVSTSDSKQRAYIDEIKVVNAGTNGIRSFETAVNDNKVYDLQGREVKAPGKDIYIVNGKKVVLTNAR